MKLRLGALYSKKKNLYAILKHLVPCKSSSPFSSFFWSAARK